MKPRIRTRNDRKNKRKRGIGTFLSILQVKQMHHCCGEYVPKKRKSC